MKRHASRIAGLLLIPAVILSSGWLPFSAPVTVHSIPEGAAVYQAGTDKRLGTTPYETHIFAAAKTLELRLDGYQTESVRLDSDSKQKTVIPLRRIPIRLETTPIAAVYEADTGKRIGITPLDLPVPAERRIYAIRRNKYYTKILSVDTDTTSPQRIELEPRPLITIRCEPKDAAVYENGTFICTAPLTTEINSPRTFEIRKDTYFSKTITLTPEQTHALDHQTTVGLTPFPFLRIQTIPANAKIYASGYSDPIGTGSVTLQFSDDTDFVVKADGYYDQPFTVKAAGDQKVSVTLEKKP